MGKSSRNCFILLLVNTYNNHIHNMICWYVWKLPPIIAIVQSKMIIHQQMFGVSYFPTKPQRTSIRTLNPSRFGSLHMFGRQAERLFNVWPLLISLRWARWNIFYIRICALWTLHRTASTLKKTEKESCTPNNRGYPFIITLLIIRGTLHNGGFLNGGTPNYQQSFAWIFPYKLSSYYLHFRIRKIIRAC